MSIYTPMDYHQGPANGSWWLHLPLPPSDNDRLRPVVAQARGIRLRRRGRYGYARLVPRLVPTASLKDYQARVVPCLRIFRGVNKYPALDRVAYLDLWVVLPSRRSDPSNRHKALLDVLQHAGLVTNDRLLLPRYQGVGYDAERPGVTVLLPRGGA